MVVIELRNLNCTYRVSRGKGRSATFVRFEYGNKQIHVTKNGRPWSSFPSNGSVYFHSECERFLDSNSNNLLPEKVKPKKSKK
jgi:hypothetical protein